jgi:hypothetical protein
MRFVQQWCAGKKFLIKETEVRAGEVLRYAESTV